MLKKVIEQSKAKKTRGYDKDIQNTQADIRG